MPDITVVSERSEKQIKEQEATDEVEFALVELTANLIRIVRGAGAPHWLIKQIVALLTAIDLYSDTVGHVPSASVFSRLIRMPEAERDLEGDRYEEALADHGICRAALQIVASSFLDQKLQRLKAMDDLQTHISLREELRNKRRRRALLEAKTPC
jgi:hypothetical protein